MKIKCHHCGYEWDYTGKKEFYSNCPNCFFKVNLKKNKVEESDNSED